MKSDLTLLCRCFGTAEALYWLPLHRPLGDAIHRLAGWQACYQRRGLAFGKDRQTVEALRLLTAAGLLATQGLTQGKAWKLTDVGALTAMNVMDLDPSESKTLLAKIGKAEDCSNICLPGSDCRLAMCWHLVPSAGPWLAKASKSAKTWDLYQNRYLSKFSVYATPLLVMGYVHLLTDGQGRLWAMRLTPEGRAALESWPVALATVAKDDKGLDAWEDGYDGGMSHAGRPAPSGFDHLVKRCLPSTAWTSAN